MFGQLMNVATCAKAFSVKTHLLKRATKQKPYDKQDMDYQIPFDAVNHDREKLSQMHIIL